MGAPPNGWFRREDPIKMGDLGVPPFMEPPCGLPSFFPANAWRYYVHFPFIQFWDAVLFRGGAARF